MNMSMIHKLEEMVHQSVYMETCPHGTWIKSWPTCAVKDFCSTLGKGEYITFPDQCVNKRDLNFRDTGWSSKIAHLLVLTFLVPSKCFFRKTLLPCCTTVRQRLFVYVCHFFPCANGLVALFYLFFSF